MERSQIQEKYKWKIEDMFSSVADWQREYDEVSKCLDFSEYKGKLGKKEAFLEFNKKSDEVSSKLEKLYVYAMMNVDTDARNSESDRLMALAQKLYATFSANLSFATPELIALDESVLKNYIADSDLSDYDYTLKNILRKKSHVLSAEVEELLASVSEVTTSFKEIFPLPLNSHFQSQL